MSIQIPPTVTGSSRYVMNLTRENPEKIWDISKKKCLFLTGSNFRHFRNTLHLMCNTHMEHIFVNKQINLQNLKSLILARIQWQLMLGQNKRNDILMINGGKRWHYHFHKRMRTFGLLQ